MGKQMNDTPDGGSAAPKKKARRSPNYPSVSLRTAVEKLPGLFDSMKRHPVGVEVAVGAMGYSYKSSSGKLALAAMRSYGFLENEQEGAGSTVKLSHRGLDIATDYPQTAPEWWSAVRDAALAPKVHAILWQRYGASLPADDELRRYLVRDLGFNDNAVGSFIRDYKDTVEFAKLSESSKIEEKTPDVDDDSEIEDDEATGKSNRRRQGKRQMTPGMKEDVFTLDSGDVVLQWPDRITAEEYEDLDSWLRIVLRKAKRAIVSEVSEPSDLED